jgi:hypothetical protein
MKIERFFYGMIDGKIYQFKTDYLRAVLSDKNFEALRNVTEEDSDKYLWFPSQQLVALPRIITVADKDGRTWVQNQTLLIGIHDYLHMTNPSKHLSGFFVPELTEVPEVFEPLEVKT